MMDHDTGMACEMEHHQRHGCGWARCSYCHHLYWMGRPEGVPIYHNFPSAHMMYYEHCATDAHQAVMKAMDRDAGSTMSYVTENWERLKVENKLWNRPEMQMLSRLLR